MTFTIQWRFSWGSWLRHPGAHAAGCRLKELLRTRSEYSGATRINLCYPPERSSATYDQRPQPFWPLTWRTPNRCTTTCSRHAHHLRRAVRTCAGVHGPHRYEVDLSMFHRFGDLATSMTTRRRSANPPVSFQRLLLVQPSWSNSQEDVRHEQGRRHALGEGQQARHHRNGALPERESPSRAYLEPGIA